jgi:cytochrome c oxidase cbb3-type subunit 3
VNLIRAILLLTGASLVAQAPATPDPGRSVFQRDCAFCHGRDAGGGESGPDLTRSKLVGEDVAGSKIAPLVRSGLPDRGMPPFKLSDPEMEAVVKFIHTTRAAAEAKPGARRGVDAADLQTGNAETGKKYFEGAGGCASCHSSTGDLAHIASKYRGLGLEQHMLSPRGVKVKVTVTSRGGEAITGTLKYRDEFTVALEDASGKYRSWAAENVKYTIDDPAAAHVALFEKYTDADIHNLMAYLQTLR